MLNIDFQTKNGSLGLSAKERKNNMGQSLQYKSGRCSKILRNISVNILIKLHKMQLRQLRLDKAYLFSWCLLLLGHFFYVENILGDSFALQDF